MTHLHWPRRARFHQEVFAFLERARRHERYFKLLIVATTSLAIAVVIRSLPWGRYLTDSFAAEARRVVRRTVGIQGSRAEVDAYWRRYRQLGIETARGNAERAFARASPVYQRLLRYAGMDPEHMLLRWGNYNWTLLLSSKLFEADDQGRSYRFKPNTHAIWLLNPPYEADGPTFFLVPDGPGLAEAIKGFDAQPLVASRQSTNSWGTRGPEPDLNAQVRGIVLGDSYMEGMFIGDSQTPPECLRRVLQARLKTSVSILNTGVFGYSPEQYYATLIAFADRFHPQFVVVSVFANDFGYAADVGNKGWGDWTEGKYWIERIVAHCNARRWPYLVVAAPHVSNLLERRNSGYYPGMLTNILNIDSLKYLYPIEDFADDQVKFVNKAKRDGRIPMGSPLFNTAIADAHFSAAGAKVWAEAVGRRLVLLLEGSLPSAPPKS